MYGLKYQWREHPEMEVWIWEALDYKWYLNSHKYGHPAAGPKLEAWWPVSLWEERLAVVAGTCREKCNFAKATLENGKVLNKECVTWFLSSTERRQESKGMRRFRIPTEIPYEVLLWWLSWIVNEEKSAMREGSWQTQTTGGVKKWKYTVKAEHRHAV